MNVCNVYSSCANNTMFEIDHAYRTIFTIFFLPFFSWFSSIPAIFVADDFLGDNWGNPGSKVAPWPGIEPRFPDSQPSMLPMDNSDPLIVNINLTLNYKITKESKKKP